MKSIFKILKETTVGYEKKNGERDNFLKERLGQIPYDGIPYLYLLDILDDIPKVHESEDGVVSELSSGYSSDLFYKDFIILMSISSTNVLSAVFCDSYKNGIEIFRYHYNELSDNCIVYGIFDLTDTKSMN